MQEIESRTPGRWSGRGFQMSAPRDFGTDPAIIVSEGAKDQPEDDLGAWKRGDTVAGSWMLCEFLGQGGQGGAWSALDLETGEPRCLKFAHAGKDDGLHAEAEALRDIRHPNVTRVFEAGFSFDGAAFLATELVSGCDLAELRREATRGLGSLRFPFPRTLALGISLDVARGLSAMHKAGLSHLDVKPSNVLVSREGAVKLCDFGSSRHTLASRLTGGTRGYCAPEIVENRDTSRAAGPLADWFSLGAMLYELLGGHRPFREWPRGGSPKGYVWAIRGGRRERLCAEDEELVGPLLACDRDPDVGERTIERLERLVRPAGLSPRRRSWRGLLSWEVGRVLDAPEPPEELDAIEEASDAEPSDPSLTPAQVGKLLCALRSDTSGLTSGSRV